MSNGPEKKMPQMKFVGADPAPLIKWKDMTSDQKLELLAVANRDLHKQLMDLAKVVEILLQDKQAAEMERIIRVSPSAIPNLRG